MVKPIGNKVLLKRLEMSNETKGGILLVAPEWDGRCEVVDVGRGFMDKYGHLHPPEIGIGDMVYIQKWERPIFQQDGSLYHILSLKEVLAVQKRNKKNK